MIDFHFGPITSIPGLIGRTDIEGCRDHLAISAKHPPRNRSASQFLQSERAAGWGIIGEQRSNIAHLHLPWRATSEYDIAPESW